MTSPRSRVRRGGRAAALVFAAFALAAAFLSACATYRGAAVDADVAVPSREPGWIWVSGVPTVRQEADKDCGAAALSAVLAYWGRATSPGDIVTALRHGPHDRIAAKELIAFAESRGFDAHALHGELSDVTKELGEGRPMIVGVAKRYGENWLSHYEVVTAYHPGSQSVLTLDPAVGWRKNALSGFLTEWNATRRIAIVVSPAGPRGVSAGVAR